MSKNSRRLKEASSAHITAAWLFLAGSIVTGILGVMRMMPAGVGGADCVCVAGLLGIIAAVLALLGIHRQNAVMYDIILPSLQGSHGSGDGGDGDT